MENTPSNTRIIGYPSSVNLRSKKSAVVSNETIVTNIDEIKNDIGLDFQNPVNFNIDSSLSYDEFGYSYVAYFPFIWFNMPSAGTYNVLPNVGQNLSLQESDIENFSSDIKYANFIYVYDCDDFINFSLPSLKKYLGQEHIEFRRNNNLTSICINK